MERRYILAGGLASELFHTISAVVYGYESFVLQARHGVATAASVRIPSSVGRSPGCYGRLGHFITLFLESRVHLTRSGREFHTP